MEMNQRRLAQEAEYAAQGMSDESDDFSDYCPECKKYGHTFMLECLALYQCEECNRGFQHWTGLQGHLATAQRHSDDAAERNRANQLKGIQRNTGRHANKQGDSGEQRNHRIYKKGEGAPQDSTKKRGMKS
eukprot:GHVN01003418.1.p1 GENE.GHVN01003418.1~~GHVN01003418.1.p1  ORF type:complete len:131 (-),score=14.42 GHVN01003418.1:150-542(-)